MFKANTDRLSKIIIKSFQLGIFLNALIIAKIIIVFEFGVISYIKC